MVLVNWGLSLTQIGLLISIEKFTCYLFELPSGWLADRWGMRKELCLCFVAYIVAFVFYYFGRESFANLVAAAFLYGLGEAMRSGPPPPPLAEAPRAMTSRWFCASQARTRRWCCSGCSGTT